VNYSAIMYSVSTELCFGQILVTVTQSYRKCSQTNNTVFIIQVEPYVFQSFLLKFCLEVLDVFLKGFYCNKMSLLIL
jgi:hypothetical protein